MTNNERAIAKLRELIAILESNVEVHRCECSMGLGEPKVVSITGMSAWSYLYRVEIEMSRKEKT